MPLPKESWQEYPLKMTIKIQRQEILHMIPQDVQLRSLIKSREYMPSQKLQAPSPDKGNSQ